MFLHIGGSQIVFESELIGIFNYDLKHTNMSLTGNPATTIDNIKSRSEYPKSFVVTDNRVYASPISPRTLSGRQNSAHNPRNIR